MSKSVMIPLSLFLRINELVDELKDSSYDFHLCYEFGDVLNGLKVKLQKLEIRKAYSQVMSAPDHESRVRARIEYLRQKRKACINRDYVREMVDAYLNKIGDATKQEQSDLREWVAAGNSPFDNPYMISGENGWPLDFISAIRIDEDMMNNPDDYFKTPPREICMDSVDDEPPF